MRSCVTKEERKKFVAEMTAALEERLTRLARAGLADNQFLPETEDLEAAAAIYMIFFHY